MANADSIKKSSSHLTGSAGVYFVAAKLNAMNFHCAATLGHAPGIDLIASSQDGARHLSLQVKTAASAGREVGKRGAKKVRYNWMMGPPKNPSARFLYTLVDLKNLDQLPDVFIIPSTYLATHYSAGWIYKPMYEEIAPFQNNWNLIKELLK